jgi:uncharacterized protein
MKSQPCYTVRNSKIHGRGVFAKRPIRKGTKIIEYTGDIVSDDEAEKIGSTAVNGHGHTMLFSLGGDKVINGNVGGAAKYINHGCTPNSEAVQYEDQVFIEAIRNIKQGEEITYDYHLIVPGKITDKVRKEYACFCGSPECRGTQIDADILKKQAKKDAAKKKKKEAKAKLKELKKLKKAEEKAARKEKKRNKKKNKDKSPSTAPGEVKVKKDKKKKKRKTKSEK